MQRTGNEHARIDALFGCVQDGLVLVDGTGNIERLNRVAERQLGVSSSQMAGQPLAALGLPAIGASVAELLRAEPSAAIDAAVERDGSTCTLACTIRPFTDAGGRAGLALALRDVTAQREFDQMCSEFVLRAAHELRTPIASVRMGLGLLGEKLDFPQGSREHELYDTVQHELTRMVDLLSDLLDLSQLRMGEHLEFADVGVGEIISAAQSRFAAAAAQSGIGWTLDLADDLPKLSICREAIDRMFDNLINNALSRMAAGGVIAFAAKRHGDNVVLTISDTGEDVPPARRSVAFEPFAPGSRKRAGVGLAICREIARRHGGEIEIHSRPSQGTRFTISLPVAARLP